MTGASCQNSHGRREPTLQSCLLTFTDLPTHMHTHTTTKYFLRSRGMLLFCSLCLQQTVTTGPAMHSLPHTNKIRGNDLFHPLACYFWKAAGVLGDLEFLNCLRPSDIAALQPSLEWARKKIKIITLMLGIKVYWLSLEVKTKKLVTKVASLFNDTTASSPFLSKQLLKAFSNKANSKLQFNGSPIPF